MSKSFNLMSPQANKRELIRRSLRFWLYAFAVVVCVLTFEGVRQWQINQDRQDQLALSETEYEPIRQLNIENAQLRRKITALQQTQGVQLALAEHRPLLGLLSLTTQAIAEHHDMVYLQQIEFERDPLAHAFWKENSVSKSATAESTLVFSIAGVSVESTAATHLVKTLRNSGPFRSVDLRFNEMSRIGNHSRQAFSIRCTN